MAISFTPVSVFQSSYTSATSFNSFLQGAHQVAQKSMMMGLPSLLNVEVLTTFPSKLFTVTEGIFCKGVSSIRKAIDAKRKTENRRAEETRFINFDFRICNV